MSGTEVSIRSLTAMLPRNTKLKTDIFAKLRIRGNTDGQQHHIRMQRLTFFQQCQHGISVLPESGDGFTQPQNYAVSAHFRMTKLAISASSGANSCFGR